MLDATGSKRAGYLTGPFLLVCMFYFLVFAAGYQLFPVVPLHLRDLGANLAESGRFQTAFMLGSGFGALFTGPMGDRLGPRRVLRVASLAVVGILGRPSISRDPPRAEASPSASPWRPFPSA